MVETECCGNCMFFAEHKGETCVRFPPPQQARVLDDDWCGEYVTVPKREKPMADDKPDPGRPYILPEGVAAAPAPKPQTKADRLSGFGDLARRIK